MDLLDRDHQQVSSCQRLSFPNLGKDTTFSLIFKKHIKLFLQSLHVSKDYNFSTKPVSISVPQQCSVPLGGTKYTVPTSVLTPVPPLHHSGYSGQSESAWLAGKFGEEACICRYT